MEESNSKSSRSSASIIPVSAFHPTPLSRTKSWRAAVLSKIGTSTGTGKGSMETELEAAKLQRATIRLESVTQALRLAVTGKEELDPLRQKSWLWYLKHLQSKLIPLWDSLIVATLAGVEPCQRYDDISAMTEVRQLVGEVAGSLFGYGEITLGDVTDRLRSATKRDLDKNGGTWSLLRDTHGDLPTHLAFQVTGWLTGLWDPLPDVATPSFRLTGRLPPRRRAGIRPDPIIRNTNLPIEKWQNQPLHRVAGRFGKLFPSPGLSIQDDTLGSRDVESACVTAAYISWHSLKDIVGVTLQWTATLGQHLEYNQQEKKLYVFKHPSICLLLCRDEPQTLLSDVFIQQQREHASSQPLGVLQGVEFEGYLAEVLLSYQLIFARNSASRKSIRRRLAEIGEECDPLLKTLCTATKDNQDVELLYAQLHAEPAENYVPIADFPFLAKKLIQLQKLSMGRNPHSFRRLWRDRRNLLAWFALWAVLIITALTLVFQMLQLVFQIWSPA
ncbi:hypothetical protein G647_03818 [Cladophialophora carrionii CBS 160.54]|uniref:Uncharacterized protein n=1 Tax=Cladophialophora carrionii CBS 160.54 TaxID=1279043 RepID=V9DC27_9EURO|nr:uncharacterized protein G647_03818 [Cladophialophora carrionii CBS 160.54]ETI24449.1 hypothetical protein G647_03818 [Cladophialophora carrionii CBS 160.54]